MWGGRSGNRKPGLTRGGVAVDMINLEMTTLDDMLASVQGGQGFILGSPTLGGHMPTQVSLALGSLLREARAREQPCGVFGSFGWSGEAVDEMQSRLRDAGFAFAFDPIRVKFKPTAKARGRRFAAVAACAACALAAARRLQRRGGRGRCGSLECVLSLPPPPPPPPPPRAPLPPDERRTCRRARRAGATSRRPSSGG